MNGMNELPERPRTLSWGDGSHESEELVDQFILTVEYGPDMSARGRPVRWLLMSLMHPYSPDEFDLEDSFRSEKGRNTHKIKLFCRILNVDGYPLVNWSVMSITDRTDPAYQSKLGVVAPDREGLAYAVQQWACNEYGDDIDADSAAWVPAVG